jgi:hypothetical protein
MSIFRRFLVCSAALMMMASIPAHAETERTGDYLIATPYGVYADTIQGQGVGGFMFRSGGKPLKIKVTDATGNTLSIRVCQDVDKSKTCDDEEKWTTCARPGVTYSIPQLYRPWDATTPVTVFIRSLDPNSDTCGNLATTGTITLTTS